MKKILFLNIILFAQLLWSVSTQASTHLPLHTLRDQSSTAHCWAYAMSHLLESRALVRENLEFAVDVERHTKYHVDFERMLHMYRTKKEVYLGTYEGGWQIEFWNTLLKYGKSALKSSYQKVEVLYSFPKLFKGTMGFIGGPKYPKKKVDSWSVVKTKLKSKTEFKNEKAAITYISDVVAKRYGVPPRTTEWMKETVSLRDTASKFLGRDFRTNNHVSDMVLIKPVKDGKHKWVKYLSDRFWGYRYDSRKVLDLVKHSLDAGYPVTFDNVGHAMSIMGYEDTKDGASFAVADSIKSRITWYKQERMLSNLNLVTFFYDAIETEIPPRVVDEFEADQDYDVLDNVSHPPGNPL